jgi:hypothetical protein
LPRLPSCVGIEHVENAKTNCAEGHAPACSHGPHVRGSTVPYAVRRACKDKGHHTTEDSEPPKPALYRGGAFVWRNTEHKGDDDKQSKVEAVERKCSSREAAGVLLQFAELSFWIGRTGMTMKGVCCVCVWQMENVAAVRCLPVRVVSVQVILGAEAIYLNDYVPVPLLDIAELGFLPL